MIILRLLLFDIVITFTTYFAHVYLNLETTLNLPPLNLPPLIILKPWVIWSRKVFRTPVYLALYCIHVIFYSSVIVSNPVLALVGSSENVTCVNEYTSTTQMGKSWLNPTSNHFHAIYEMHRREYFTWETLQFSCLPGTSLLHTNGLTVMQTTCLAEADNKKGRWSKEWPMCKGIVKLWWTSESIMN